MGALVLRQTSVWRWDVDHAELLWIKTYNFSLDVDEGIHYLEGMLSIIEKRFPRTFTSCNGCFEPTTEQRLRITPTSVEDLGERTRIPELDLIDELFWRIAHNLSTNSITTPEVRAKLQRPILDITKDSKSDDPSSFYIGMLDDWAVTRGNDGSQVCIIVGELNPLNFTLSHGKIASVAERKETSGMCPHPVK